MHEKHIGADGRICADDGFAAENGGVRINGYVVRHVRMALATLDDLAGSILSEAARAERHVPRASGRMTSSRDEEIEVQSVSSINSSDNYIERKCIFYAVVLARSESMFKTAGGVRREEGQGWAERSPHISLVPSSPVTPEP